MATQFWTADRRIYLDAEGRAVEATDPARRTLLAPVGGLIPLAQARALGLVTDPADPPPAGKPAPVNKARRRPAEDK